MASCSCHVLPHCLVLPQADLFVPISTHHSRVRLDSKCRVLLETSSEQPSLLALYWRHFCASLRLPFISISELKKRTVSSTFFVLQEQILLWWVWERWIRGARGEEEGQPLRVKPSDCLSWTVRRCLAAGERWAQDNLQL